MEKEKKLDNLKNLFQPFFDMVAEDFATPQDVLKMSEAMLGVVNRYRLEIENKIAENKGIADTQAKSSLASLSATEKRIQALIARNTTDVDTKLSKATTQLSKEIKRVESKIPTKTDLSEIESKLEELEEKLPNIATEITSNSVAVRDALELLMGEERLDADAIKGLERFITEQKVINDGGLRASNGWKNYSSTLFNSLTVSETEPVNPVLHDLWIDIS